MWRRVARGAWRRVRTPFSVRTGARVCGGFLDWRSIDNVDHAANSVIRASASAPRLQHTTTIACERSRRRPPAAGARPRVAHTRHAAWHTAATSTGFTRVQWRRAPRGTEGAITCTWPSRRPRASPTPRPAACRPRRRSPSGSTSRSTRAPSCRSSCTRTAHASACARAAGRGVSASAQRL